jgi:hypothetical protein
MDHKQKLTFVLLCSGNGADSSIYRPNGDDKRYRHRQDALVRCVASTLYSAAGVSTHGSCELILLYDGDLSCMKMKLLPSGIIKCGGGEVQQQVMAPTPLEKDIVKSWKIAANEATRQHHHHQQQSSSSIGTMGTMGSNSLTRAVQNNSSNSDATFQLQTTCVLNSWREESPTKINHTNTNTASSKCFTKNKHVKLPFGMPASKRDAISMLQSSCSLDFLRSHRLNAPLDVALKKFNKSKVQAVWDAAKKEEDKNGGADSESGDTSSSRTQQQTEHDKRMEGIFHNILAKAKGNEFTAKEYSTDVVAAYLHESCDAELPCWSNNDQLRNREVKHIFLFCGAVRDMTNAEQLSLSSVSNKLKIPLLPCRLGPVPEFTSKIVSVAGHHFYKGVLGHGLIKLWERKRKQTTLIQDEVGSSSQPLDPLDKERSLHTIAIIPIQSSLLTADPSKRCRIHWCMVRLCVCALYRSKLASTLSTRKALDNKLSFVFEDMRTLTLDQHGFISSLAEKHQAAPSERQILEELCRRRDDVLLQQDKDGLNKLISSYNSNQGDVYALDFTNKEDESHLVSNQVMELAYSEDCPSDNATAEGESTLIAILQVRDQNANTTNSISHKAILDAIAKSNIQVRTQAPLVSEAQDGEALTVIMLQHLDYQRKLFGLLRQVFEESSTAKGSSKAKVPNTSESGRKRKKKHKDGKKKKKKSKKIQHI